MSSEGKHMKILVADDDENNLLLSKLELRDELWQVITASNGREAIELFESENPDMVIIDVKMPDIDGITVLKKMKKIRPKIPIAIFTGFDRAALAVPSEADAFMIKSSSYKELKEFVRKYAPIE
jgi:DNA-binding NtrC family response regulator